MKKTIMLFFILFIFLGCKRIEIYNSSKNKTFKGTYIIQLNSSVHLNFLENGFVYVDFLGVGSDYWNELLPEKQTKNNIFKNILKISIFKEYNIIPTPNFYKYEMIHNQIFIDLKSNGYYGLEIKDSLHLQEISNKKNIWEKWTLYGN